MRRMENCKRKVLGSDPATRMGNLPDLLHGVWINQLLSKNHWRRVERDRASTLEKELRTPSKTTVTEEFVRLCANNSMSSIIVDQQIV